MNWDRYETDEIVRLINSLWPQSKPISEKQAHLLQVRMPGSAKVAMQAIEDVAAEREQSSRPGIGMFIKKAEEITRNSLRLSGKQGGDKCPWCEGRRIVQVQVWQISGSDAAARGIPDNMLLKQRSGIAFVVDPRIGPELGIEPTTLSLDCGHCDWHAGRLCIQDFDAYYKGFWRYASLRDEDVGAKCLSSEEPLPDAEMTLREFLEHEDVSDETVEFLEKSRRVNAGAKS